MVQRFAGLCLSFSLVQATLHPAWWPNTLHILAQRLPGSPTRLNPLPIRFPATCCKTENCCTKQSSRRQSRTLLRPQVSVYTLHGASLWPKPPPVGTPTAPPAVVRLPALSRCTTKPEVVAGSNYSYLRISTGRMRAAARAGTSVATRLIPSAAAAIQNASDGLAWKGT